MSALYSSGNIAYGSGEIWETMPILNLPADTLKVRRRIRSTELMKVYVKTPTAVRCYEVDVVGNALRLAYPIAQNTTEH